MSKVGINTTALPNPMPDIFSQAVVVNGLVFCSGQVGQDASGALVEGDIQARTHQIFKNLSTVLEAAGSSLDKLVKVNVFITNMENFNKVNEVYKQYVKGPNLPVRTCVAVAQLPKGTDVEIECSAVL